MSSFATGRPFFLAMLAAVTAWLFATSAAGTSTNAQAPVGEQAAEPQAGWFCPMHPDITSNAQGRCRKCNMELVAGNPFDTREYGLDVASSPAAVRAGTPFTLGLTVRQPGSGEVVKAFETVHERKFHLFLVSHDMTEFQHIHPEMNASGEWVIEATVPKPGFYRVLGDFLPTGAGPQFLGRTLLTAGYDGDLEGDTAALTPDTVLTKQVDDITATLSFEPAKLVAGEFGHLDFSLTDARTGDPVTDLQPYLGAYGHTLILSEDLADVVHAHPSEWYNDNGVRYPEQGPRARFEGYMPRPGIYRAWTQFQRHDRVSTFTFTFRVYSAYELYQGR